MTTAVRSVWREARRSVPAARGFSLVLAGTTLVLAALLVGLVGQARAQNQAVLDGFQTPERRTITVDAVGDLPVLGWHDCESLAAMGELGGCWSTSRAFDVGNPHLLGAVASARTVSGQWDGMPVRLVGGRLPARAGEAVADEASVTSLRLGDSGGAVVDVDGREWAVVGTYRPLNDKAPTGVLVPLDAASAIAPHSTHVVAKTVAGVPLVVSTTLSVVSPASPDAVKVTRAQDLSTLSGQVAAGTLRGGQVVVYAVFGVSWLVVAMMSLLMVRARAAEFGRRRALGATRGWLLTMVLVQGLLVALPSALAGCSVGAAWNAVVHHAAPQPRLIAPLVAWQCLSALSAQLLPAVSACLRDPVRVLRSP